MSNCNKKIVTDVLELYRLGSINVLYCKESMNAFNADIDFAIELGKLNKFLINTKLTRMPLTKRISYRAFVYTKMMNCTLLRTKNSLWIKLCMKNMFHIHNLFMKRVLIRN